MVPVPPLTITSNGFAITPPSQISSGVVGIIAVGSKTMVIVILLDVTSGHPPEEKLTIQ